MLGASLAFFLGPLGQYPSAEVAVIESSAGSLARDADAQHVVRMVSGADLTHSNPAFPPLAAAWAGLTIAALQVFGTRRRYWLVVALLVAVSISSGAGDTAEELGLDGDEAVSTGLPLLTAIAGYLLTWHLRRAWRFAVAGGALALHAVVVWGGESPAPYVLAAVAAPVAAVLGSRGGEWLAGVVREPARPGQGALALILGMGIVVPAVTGLVDLGLRTAIP